jgi:malate permease and related proteins
MIASILQVAIPLLTGGQVDPKVGSSPEYRESAIVKALESVFSIVAMIALGFLLAKRRWFEGNAPSLVSRLVVSVSLPAYMVANLSSNFDRTSLVAALPGLPIPFAVMGFCLLVGLLVARVARVRQGRKGTFVSMFSLSNTIFIGLPVNLMLFGEKSLPYVLLYYIANTSLFWTVGAYCLSRDGGLRGAFSAETAKRIFSPPLVAFLGTSALILAGLRIPGVILDVCRYVGGMTTPLSMLFIGIVIASVDWRKTRPDATMALLFIGRFAIAPAAAYALATVAGSGELMRKVFVIQASMPAMTQTSIVAKAYGADYEYAALMTAATTIAGLAAVPVFAALLGS